MRNVDTGGITRATVREHIVAKEEGSHSVYAIE